GAGTVVAGQGAVVDGQRQHPHLGEVAGEHGAGVVGGGVVGDEGLGPLGQREEVAQGDGEPAGAVPGGDDDAERAGRGRSGHGMVSPSRGRGPGSRARASRTSAGVMRSSAGSVRWACGSPSGPYQRATWRGWGGGPQRRGGTGPKRATVGVPWATARCATPVSPLTTARASATRADSGPNGTPPARTSLPGSPARSASRATRPSSSAPPVTTTRRPRARRATATAAYRSTGQQRAGDPAPGCRTTAPGAGDTAAGRGSSRSAGSASMPYQRSRRHQRSRSCSSAYQGGPSMPGVPGCAKASSRPGRRRDSRRWLGGPLPCRSTATSGGRPGPVERGGHGPAGRGGGQQPVHGAGGPGDRG